MSSELKDPEFHSRLSRVIGGERPYAWAERVGISKGAFSRIWNEGTIPGPDHLRRIREVAGVSIDWLLTGDGNPNISRPTNTSIAPGFPERLLDITCDYAREEISLLSGSSNINIGSYERGESIPDANFIASICKMSGVNASWLLFGEPPKFKHDVVYKTGEQETHAVIDVTILRDVLETLKSTVLELMSDGLIEGNPLIDIEKNADLIAYLYEEDLENEVKNGTRLDKKSRVKRIFRIARELKEQSGKPSDEGGDVKPPQEGI